MSWHTVQLADSAPQAWKNGGGITRELLAWPSADDWHIRLSVADITANGPFSTFVEVQRWFAVLQGDGVCLTVEGTPTHLHTNSPAFCFSGGASTTCKLLGGHTRDFNLMLRGVTGQLQRIQGQAAGRLTGFRAQDNMKMIAVYAIGEKTNVRFDQDVCRLEPGTLAWRLLDNSALSAHANWSVQADNALWMEISP